jgi:hypothetical protein
MTLCVPLSEFVKNAEVSECRVGRRQRHACYQWAGAVVGEWAGPLVSGWVGEWVGEWPCLLSVGRTGEWVEWAGGWGGEWPRKGLVKGRK